MPSEYPSRPRRLWQLRPWRRSALLRPSDRVQSWLHVTLAGLLVAMLPLAVLLGIAVHGRVLVASRAADTVVVPATLDDDVARLTYRANALAVPAHWTVAGHPHSGLIDVAGQAKRGDRVPLRVDAAGNPAPRPPRADEALPDAVLAALLGLALADATLLVLWRVACRSLDGHRRNQWAREWALVDLTSHGRA